MEPRIRLARKSGDSTVITMSGYAEAGEYFLLERVDDTIILKKVSLPTNMNVKEE